MYTDLNPKTVTNDELYGIINPATREWKDGLFSVIMRDQANLTTEGRESQDPCQTTEKSELRV